MGGHQPATGVLYLMGWSNRHWYEAETLTAMLLRIRDTTDACHAGPTASLDQARAERHHDFQPARVEPLLRGPLQPAANAAGPTGDAGPRVVPRARASTPDPALPDNSAAA